MFEKVQFEVRIRNWRGAELIDENGGAKQSKQTLLINLIRPKNQPSKVPLGNSGCNSAMNHDPGG